MKRHFFLLAIGISILLVFLSCSFSDMQHSKNNSFDIVVVGSTPGGIMTAVSAARMGSTVALFERTEHIGGLPANGLGATDIHTRGATAGLFTEFVGRVKFHYIEEYGTNSQQVKDCSNGYHFEPHVAELVLEEMIAEQPGITVFKNYQFDSDSAYLKMQNNTIQKINMLNRKTDERTWFSAKIFIDATYEGDLAAAAGVPFRVGREGFDEFKESMAGRIFKAWNGPVSDDYKGEADDAIQAYNYRLCLTDDKDNQVSIPKPKNYNRDEYTSLIKDVLTDHFTGKPTEKPQGIGRVVNMVKVPNQKTDSNNQHWAFISTDLPEENWPWPTADWQWRDNYAERLKNYTLGLLWFAQNDPELPLEFRSLAKQWAFAADEYADNSHFPRAVYVREGRRMQGEYFFTAHDALPVHEGERPPIHANSITSSHYAIDSHAVRKRESGKIHLDGFLSLMSAPYSVPYGVILPVQINNLLTPVPVSGSHLGFSTLRMEPCWMALGQAAGTASAIALQNKTVPKEIDIEKLQRQLLEDGAVLFYFRNMSPSDPGFKASQLLGLKGLLTSWEIPKKEHLSTEEIAEWYTALGVSNMLLDEKLTILEILKDISKKI